MPRRKAGANLPGPELPLQDLGTSGYLGTQLSVGEIYEMEGGNPITVFSYLMYSYREKEARSFFKMHSKKRKDHRHKWLQRKIQLEIRKNLQKELKH